MDYEVCIRCNIPYEDINNVPHCPDCEELYKSASDKLIVA